MLAQQKPYITPEQYLEMERLAEIRSEYYGGEMFAMSGGTDAHSLIKVNIGGELWAQLKKRPCRVFDSDMRLKVEASGLYTYPDISVVCEEPLFENERRDSLLNPRVIVEVLSPSTEAWDRGRKFEHYRKIPTLQEYVLVAQDTPRVERFFRQRDGTWVLSEAYGLDAALLLTSIDCQLELADLYDKVEFPESSRSPSPGDRQK